MRHSGYFGSTPQLSRYRPAPRTLQSMPTAAAPELVVGRPAVIADNDVAIADFRVAEVNLGLSKPPAK